jgi:hypothetical protein
MLRQEAEWLGSRISELDSDAAFPLLNVGSSTEDFRTTAQPFIDALIFRPLRQLGKLVIHVDMKSGAGVDVVGDVFDPQVREKLAATGFRSLLCSNMLEHVPDARAMGKVLLSLVPAGGYLLVTCPHRYPYHPDPIDTMFRPGVAELAELFAGARLIRGEVIGGGMYRSWRAKRPAELLRNVVRVACPFYKPARWLWSFRTMSSTCAVLRKMAA